MSSTAATPGITENQIINLSARARKALEREIKRADFADDDAAASLSAALAAENLDWEYSRRYAGRREQIKVFSRRDASVFILY